MDFNEYEIQELKSELIKGIEQAQEFLGCKENKLREFPYSLDNINLVSIFNKSNLALKGFTTLDIELASAIRYSVNDLNDYIKDDSRKRPHNLLMLASPGSGKSHLAECIAKELKIPLVSGNLSIGNTSDVLLHVANQARNFKAQDSIPLIFLDEVDSNTSNYSTLLPLLWDGEIFLSGQIMKLGRCIIICAASNESWEPNSVKNIKDGENSRTKLRDFLSRFDAGVLKVHSITSDTRRYDRLCVTVSLLRKRFPNISHVSLGLLQLLSLIQVEHEVRSIEFLINLIPIDSVLPFPHEYKETCPGSSSYIGIDKELNKNLCKEIERLLTFKEKTIAPLSLHITSENRDNALDLWRSISKNIGLIKLPNS